MSIEKLSPLAVPFVGGAASPPVISVDFSASPRTAEIFDIISFIAIISGGITPIAFLWEFGDGFTSAEMNPTHGYKVAGAFTISLTVYISGGFSYNATKYYYIVISERDDTGLIDDLTDRASNLLIEEVRKQYGDTRTVPLEPGDPEYISTEVPENPDPVTLIDDMEDRAVNLLIENVRKQYGEG